jgi:hypothetical protein
MWWIGQFANDDDDEYWTLLIEFFVIREGREASLRASQTFNASGLIRLCQRRLSWIAGINARSVSTAR